MAAAVDAATDDDRVDGRNPRNKGDPMIWLPILIGGLVVLALVSDDGNVVETKQELTEEELAELKRQRNKIQKQLKKHKAQMEKENKK